MTLHRIRANEEMSDAETTCDANGGESEESGEPQSSVSHAAE